MCFQVSTQPIHKMFFIFIHRKLAIKNVIDTYKDLAMFRSYAALSDYVESVVGLDKYREELVEDEAKNRMLVTFFIF